MARRRLIWTEPALADLDEIADYIALDYPAAARALVRRVFEAAERLVRAPQLGRRLPELPNTPWRELILPPCRVIYRLDGTSIVIIHVPRSEQRLRPSRLR